MENTMSKSDRTWEQATHFLRLVTESGTPSRQVQALIDGGYVAALLKANVDNIDMNEFRRVLGLSQLTGVVRKTIPTTIHVDHSTRPPYPDWASPEWINAPAFMALEATGPADYGIEQIVEWLHDDQKKGIVGGTVIHDYLNQHRMRENCLGLADLLAIQNLGTDFFYEHFQGKGVFGWKSVVQDRNGDQRVSLLLGSHGQVKLNWAWLVDDSWDRRSPALRFER